MKNIRLFISENFQFLVVKFSMYLNRRVFVMERLCAMKCCTVTSQILPLAGFELWTLWSEIGNTNHSATQILHTLFFQADLVFLAVSEHCVHILLPVNDRSPSVSAEEKEWPSKSFLHQSPWELFGQPEIWQLDLQSDTLPTGLWSPTAHYENTPIQIYRKFQLQKRKIFR